MRARLTAAPFVVIEYHSHRNAWKAIWGDKVDRFGKFEGTREEVIAWARERCDVIYLSPGPGGDYPYPVQLGPDDE